MIIAGVEVPDELFGPVAPSIDDASNLGRAELVRRLVEVGHPNPADHADWLLQAVAAADGNDRGEII